MNIEGLSEFICKKMESELPPFVIYHGVDHTYDVHASVIRLSQLENLDEYNTQLVRAAAWLHDAGIIVKFEDHEVVSAQMAEEYLPSFGFNEQEIVLIKNMILTTRLPQLAATHNEKILCDADLDYLGRNDFFIIGQKLRLEWELIGNKINLYDWYMLQLQFLKNHHYFTKSAQILRNERKNINMAEIQHFFNSTRLNK
ncbi:MAG: HD domain-containing protein [Omnitrophica WOR_2 bacterium]